MPEITPEEIGRTLPSEMPVSVMLERRPASNPWEEEQWEVVGIASTARERDAGELVKIHEEGGVSRYLQHGLVLSLHRDECESYYHNLMTATPRCYVVARTERGGRPSPFLIGLSFDEAHAYLEADDLVYAVPIPGEIYRWCEAYVLAHYVPRPKRKRKLDRGNGAHGK